jgi:hypothetical protein
MGKAPGCEMQVFKAAISSVLESMGSWFKLVRLQLEVGGYLLRAGFKKMNLI